METNDKHNNYMDLVHKIQWWTQEFYNVRLQLKAGGLEAALEPPIA
jgi:hypothetical protein